MEPIEKISSSKKKQGLWRKTNTYFEQPAIEFNNRCIFVLGELNGNYLNNFLYWSSFEELNGLNLDILAIPIIQTNQIDKNNDGKIKIDVMFTLPLKANKTYRVHSFSYVFNFEIRLEHRSIIKLQSSIFGVVERFYSAKSISIWSDLNVIQKKLLPSLGVYDIINKSQKKQLNILNDLVENQLLDTGENKPQFDSAQLYIREIQLQNFQQNFSIEAFRKIENWYPTFEQNDNNFNATFQFIVREQSFTYQCGLVELLKWAWIQYFCILIIVRYIFRSLSIFLYENQVLTSIVYSGEKLKLN